ncbi:MAG: hypothetical protein R3C68_07445 [Myxococcota bacterium]
MASSLCYAAKRLGEITDDIVNIDRAMRWGFNWDLGPFEAWDAINVAQSVTRMQKKATTYPLGLSICLRGRQNFYDTHPPGSCGADATTNPAKKLQDPRLITHINL